MGERRHVLVVEPDPGNPSSLIYRIECAGDCDGWQECYEDHPITWCDGCPMTDCADIVDGDTAIFHGVEHQYHDRYGWMTAYPGCVVADHADDAADIASDAGPGRWVVNDDWNSFGECYLDLIGPDPDR